MYIRASYLWWHKSKILKFQKSSRYSKGTYIFVLIILLHKNMLFTAKITFFVELRLFNIKYLVVRYKGRNFASDS